MSPADFHAAIDYLRTMAEDAVLVLPDGSQRTGRQLFMWQDPATSQSEGEPRLVLPYHATPGARPGGNTHFTEQSWELYGWNPPQYLDYSDPDDQAGAKPTWDMLRAAATAAQLAEAQRHASAELKQVVQARINRVYGAANNQAEIWLRLRGQQTAEQDLARDRLLDLYHSQRAAIRRATTSQSVNALLAAVSRDAFWAAPAAD